ncbi:hypothetical protein VNO77_33067 [Canavalia gladiata]|uniref:Uncharacterized protein n=1 Tax=Canavalia gladiata TaxID=3824 RepID=A0AAN9PXE1_CANGL
MEVEKRTKKRVIREEIVEEESDKLNNNKLIKGTEEGPTEEEVEEFFAILRRMKVAVKYFDDKGRRGGKEWREALETAEVAVDHGQDVANAEIDDKPKKKAEKVILNEDFDLNAVAPEAAESGGA